MDLSAGLVSLGLKKSDKVCLFSENSSRWLVSDQAGLISDVGGPKSQNPVRSKVPPQAIDPNMTETLPLLFSNHSRLHHLTFTGIHLQIHQLPSFQREMFPMSTYHMPFSALLLSVSLAYRPFYGPGGWIACAAPRLPKRSSPSSLGTRGALPWSCKTSSA